MKLFMVVLSVLAGGGALVSSGTMVPAFQEEESMNYYIIRYISLIIILLILILINFIILRKNKRIKNKVIIMSIIIMVVSYILMWNISFEKKIINFSTIQEAFEYSYPMKKIMKVFENEESAFVLYGPNNGNFNYTYFTKTNNRWNFTTPQISVVKTKGNLDSFVIVTVKIPNKNLKLIDVEYVDFFINDSQGKSFNIEDSMGSEFEVTKLEVTEDTNYYLNTVIIEDVPENYYLIINGEEVTLP